jgi:microcystin degradation protein MlrC
VRYRYPNPIARRLLILLPIALVLAACGSFADGNQGSLETAIDQALSHQIESYTAMVQVRSVDCVRKDAATQCEVQLGVGNVVVSLHYDVVLDSRRCWVATAHDVRVDGAGSQTNPIAKISRASNLTGCLQ